MESTVYRDYTMSLANDTVLTRQETAFSDASDLVARRMGFIPLPLGVAMLRVLCMTITPSARPADIILLVLVYFILVTLSILNSIIILGKASDLISSRAKTENTDFAKPFLKNSQPRKTDPNDANLGTAILSNSAVSLNNVCMNDAMLKVEKLGKLDKEMGRSSDDIVEMMKNVVKSESEPLLPQ